MSKPTKKLPARDPKDKLYIDFDEEYEWWGVFGDRSGHCYATFSDREEAVERYPQADQERDHCEHCQTEAVQEEEDEDPDHIVDEDE